MRWDYKQFNINQYTREQLKYGKSPKPISRVHVGRVIKVAGIEINSDPSVINSEIEKKKKIEREFNNR